MEIILFIHLNITMCRIGKSHMKTGFFQLWFLKKKIWSKYTLGIVVSWYNLRNCNIWLLFWHLSPQSGPFHQFWSFLLILFSKTTQKKSKHYSGRAFLEVLWKVVQNIRNASILWFRDFKYNLFYILESQLIWCKLKMIQDHRLNFQLSWAILYIMS